MYPKKNNQNLKEDVSKYVTELFKENLPSWAVYHDLSHTVDAVTACEEIGKGSGLSEEDIEILYIAAWFHDTGYILQVDGHEEKSSKMTFEFLFRRNYPKEKIDKVVGCIMATKVSNQPHDLVESIICDADLISLGRVDYFEKNNLLRTEIERRENRVISELEWLKRSLNFLSSHKYYSEYARQTYGYQLNQNIQNLKDKIAEHR
jgi:predicted metal-dependent HD superfamily phosphohydrolase